MVERAVKIEVKGTSDGQTIELKTTGKYIKKNESEYLEYLDDDNVRNYMKIEKDSIYLTKYTNPPTNMIFKEKEKHEFKYQTPCGSMDMSILTKELKVNQQGYDYDICIRYDMIVSEEIMEKELTILVR
ncbi:MAG TPA: hypothetical protein DCP90_01165 [Clostridiales bacterium]|nr:MAG: hypothetical protein A2Y22_01785 [Clostridiales bacterium GWD2_32_59]HAN09207.1 hypothetical protein [Clostridiales bacterium]